MPLFGKKENRGVDYKTRLEHKLYLARENPEPVFDLSDCGLKTVPAGIYSLCKVFRKEILCLQENFLVSLAGGGKLQDLSLLKVLDLHSNRLILLPNDICYLKNLRELNVKGNQLTHIPDDIKELESLEILIASENDLKQLPNSIGCLRNLQHLDIRLNKNLTLLPTSLCKASALRQLLLSPESFTFPSEDVLHQGTVEILKFLAADCGHDYEESQTASYEVTGAGSSSVQEHVLHDKENKLEAKILQLERLKEQKQKERLALEKIIEEQQQKELDLRVAMKRSKEKLLEDLVEQQVKLESEILRIQQGKEADRQLLLQELQQEEIATESVVSQLLSVNTTERNSVYLQQLLEREREEEEHILNMHQEEYRNLRRRDILSAMERLLEEECLQERKLREYEKGRLQSTKTLLDQEMESNKQLEECLMNYGMANTELVTRLHKDEELQRAAVATLLERSDARSWGLVQQVRLVESQLAALTALEMKRRSLKLAEHVDDLCEKRVALSELLMDLLEQQDVRRKQLLSTLKELERRRWLDQEQQVGGDFWLLQYQRLLDSRSSSLMEMERSLDPALAHQLILNGVIHCLPFLADWLSSPCLLLELTDSNLAEVGISSSETRQAILKAIENYNNDMSGRNSRLQLENVRSRSPVFEQTPTAPTEADVELVSSIGKSECVVCMELMCEVIFVPCGHLCCCIKCSELVNNCPMCRSCVEQKVRVILP